MVQLRHLLTGKFIHVSTTQTSRRDKNNMMVSAGGGGGGGGGWYGVGKCGRREREWKSTSEEDFSVCMHVCVNLYE